MDRDGQVGRVTAENDFFISYTGADTAWAEWIADTLQHASYTTGGHRPSANSCSGSMSW
jgi:hypothetical protein